MARRAVGITITSTVIGNEGFHKLGAVADPINAATTVVDQAAVEAAVALLEADAGSPTQGHVNALRTVWDLLKADIGGVPASSDVLLSYDPVAVGNQSVFRRAVAQLVAAAAGANDLTP